MLPYEWTHIFLTFNEGNAFDFLFAAHSGRQYAMAQSLGSLLPAWETLLEFLALHFTQCNWEMQTEILPLSRSHRKQNGKSYLLDLRI